MANAIQQNELIQSGPDWKFNACLNYMADNRDIYAYGYLKAADALIEHLIEKEHGGADYFLYPILFLCRHHLELKLKNIIHAAARLTSRNILKDELKIINSCHELPTLFAIARKDIEEIWSESDKEPLEKAAKVLNDLEALDPKSFASRYPTNSKTNESHLKDYRHINILSLREGIDEAVELLDSIDNGISHYQDCQNEMNQWEGY